MAFVLATAQTAFATYLTAVGTTATAKATITGLGAFPAFPTIITVTTDYTAIASSQVTWLASYATASATYVSALAAQRVTEVAVINSIIGMTTNASQPAFGANEWYVHSDGTHWFGYSSKDASPVDGLPYLVVETTLPTKSFANSVS